MILKNKQLFSQLLKMKKIKYSDSLINDITDEVTNILGEEPCEAEGLVLKFTDDIPSGLSSMFNMGPIDNSGINSLSSFINLMNTAVSGRTNNIIEETNSENDAENIKKIEAMGFTKEQAEDAYNRHKSVEEAIDYLLGN